MKKPVKFLIVRFSSIGDIVLTTPVVRCLKMQYDGPVEIHYLTKSIFLPLLRKNPYIDRFYTIEDNVSEIRHELISENYDYIIDLHKNLRSMKVKRIGKAPSFSFDKLNFEKWLLVNFKINRLPDVHIVDRYMDTLLEFGIENDNQGLDFFIDEEEHVDDLPDSFAHGYIAVSVGAAHATKTMPAGKMQELLEKTGKPVVLLGGKEDFEKAELIRKANPGIIHNGCGKYSITQSAWLIKNAKVVISHDTGLMHIASAFGKKLISVWGNTVPEFGMFPYMPQHPGRSVIYQVNGLKCRPCSKLGFDKCPLKHFKCMNLIDTDEVAKQAIKWFDQKD